MTPRERRQVAVSYLRSIPQEVADQHVFMGNFMAKGIIPCRLTLRQLLTKCGTTACAGGWLCFVPPLIEERLTPRPDGIPQYRGKYGLDALKSFFGLAEDEATAIFFNYRLSGKAALDEVCRQLEAIP